MSRRLTLIFALALLNAFVAGRSPGQTFYFADGRKVSMPEARLKGQTIVTTVKLAGAEGGSAEITLPIAKLIRIDWPAPAALAEADDALTAGHPAEALKKIDAMLAAQEPLMKVPGSWWKQGAVIKAVALARLGKNPEADAVLARMRDAKADPADLARGELAIVDQLVAVGKTDDANARIEKIQATADDDASLASLALAKGRIAERANQPEAALLSYLRVPVLYSAEEDQLPAALLGAARAYAKLNDKERAAATLKTLVTRFPKSPEAAEAKL